MRNCSCFFNSGAYALLVVLCLCGCRSQSTQPLPPQPADAPAGWVLRCAMNNPDIPESSGLAESRVTPGVWFTHNDSDNAQEFYAITETGERRGAWRIPGITATWEDSDIEDLASLIYAGKPCLIIGDCGDTTTKPYRTGIQLYIVADPGAGKPGTTIDAEALLRIDASYPDGPRDCESIAVSPDNSTVYLLEKTLPLQSSRMYCIDLTKCEPGQPVEATPFATLPFSMATAMDLRPDGNALAVLTYGMIYFYEKSAEEPLLAMFSRKPQMIPIPVLAQAEALGWSRDGTRLLISSERLPLPLWEYRFTK